MQIEGLQPLPVGVLDTLRRASTASVTSELFKLGIRHSFMNGVAPLAPGETMIGEAVTLRYLPYREDLVQSVANTEHPQRKTINTMGPGQILVVDARGSLRSGTLGEILVARIKAVGGAGVVTDGAVRDSRRWHPSLCRRHTRIGQQHGALRSRRDGADPVWRRDGHTRRHPAG
jgi:regulator of RNase E activity RraA